MRQGLPTGLRNHRAVIMIAVVCAVVAAIVSFSWSNFPRTRLLSSEQTVLPFNGLNQPDGVAVGHDGSVYITDLNARRVLKLSTGSTHQSVMPFNGLNSPEGVAVDAAGAVYVTDSMNGRVLKLTAA